MIINYIIMCVNNSDAKVAKLRFMFTKVYRFLLAITDFYYKIWWKSEKYF